MNKWIMFDSGAVIASGTGEFPKVGETVAITNPQGATSTYAVSDLSWSLTVQTTDRPQELVVQLAVYRL